MIFQAGKSVLQEAIYSEKSKQICLPMHDQGHISANKINIKLQLTDFFNQVISKMRWNSDAKWIL